MNKISVSAALRSGRARRAQPYVHKVGKFLMTTNFRDSKIDKSTIRLAGALSVHFTQKQIALMLGVSVSLVSKFVRIFSAGGAE